MRKKNRKRKLTKVKKLRRVQKNIRHARSVSRLLTVIILSVLGYLAYSDVSADRYSLDDYLFEVQEIDTVFEELQQAYPATTTPTMIMVCWSARQQRLVPDYQGCK